jgi:hypothetical protein
MKILKTFHNETKTANIGLQDETLVVEFYENQRRVGEIEYPNNSYYYVEDAAENWILGVMTEETIKNYQKIYNNA